MTAAPLVVDASSVTGRPTPDGALIERAVLGRHTGTSWLEQSVLELDSGCACSRATGSTEEVLFVLSGCGELRVRDRSLPLEPETGVYLPAGHEYTLSAPRDEELLVVSVRIPEPLGNGTHPAPLTRRLTEQDAEAATAERAFKIIFDPGTGLRSATHFVGYIPVGRAPEHFHTYDEVIYILDGEGAFHTADRSWAVGPGSCIALPARTVHCLENTGRAEMRVVAVFRPAGSPAAAYYPDGTPAFTHEQPASPHEEEVA